MLQPQFLSTGKVQLFINRVEENTEQYVDGRYVPSESTERLCIEANVQPRLTTRELYLLPEGDRTKDSIKVYTAFTLRGRREGDSPIDADTFTWDGATYEVVVAHTYQMGVLNHTKALAIRRELT